MAFVTREYWPILSREKQFSRESIDQYSLVRSNSNLCHTFFFRTLFCPNWTFWKWLDFGRLDKKNVQNFIKRPNIQTSECPMFRCANVRASKCPNVQMSKHPPNRFPNQWTNVQDPIKIHTSECPIFKRSNVHMSKCPNVQMSKRPNVQTSTK